MGLQLLFLAFFALQAFVMADLQQYDYIVVGGGTCGLTVANRLSEDPSVSVAVIDPGDDQRQNPNVTDPAIWVNNMGTSTDWNYASVPQQGANGRILRYIAGKGIGGTSLINGMTYIRGDKAQFDAWERLGNAGWNWNTLLPYYKALEHFTPPSRAQEHAGASYDPKFHGTNGAIHVGYPYDLENGTLSTVVSKTWNNLSFPVNKDANSGSTYGFDVWPQTLDRDRNYRWDAATAFYWPVQHRQNLKLIKGTGIKAIWSASQQAGNLATVTGVEYVDTNNRTWTAHASREVIVSAGSLRTPLFLELSGIGNPNILTKYGIPVKVDLPSVGENLQDQPNTNIIYTSTFDVTGYAPYATFATASDLFGKNTSAVAHTTRESIPAWAKLVADASGGAVSASALKALYNVQHDLIFKQHVTIAEILPTASATLLVAVWWGLLPFSRGSVHLSGLSISDEPAINPNFFLIDHDLDVNIAAGKLCQRFFQTQPVKNNVTGKLAPDDTTLPDNATDAQWAAYIRGATNSNSHPIATASMMSRELGGVVDSQLKVYGTSNLRVVDASVLPTQFSGHLTATLYVVAQRASEFIKQAAH